MTRPHDESPRADRKALAGLGGGVMLEWYDWVVYGLLAAYIGPAFFPGNDPVAETLSALAVFALGFVARPVGAMVFGPVADRISHKLVMLVSVSTMALTSLAIGLMPTYEVIGVWATVAIVVLRLCQGLATGAEAPIANVIAMELAPRGRSGWYLGVVSGSFVQGGVLLAQVVAFFSTLALGEDAMHAWGWRLPFLAGGVMGLAVLYLRKQLPETLAPAIRTGEPIAHESTPPGLWSDLARHWRPILTALFVVGGVQVLNYTWATGLPNLANATYEENSRQVFGIVVGFGVLMVAAGPAVGALADRYDGARVYSILRLLGIPAALLVLAYSEPGIGTFAAVMMLGGLVVAANMGLYNYVATSLIPTSCRTTGVGIAYGFGVSLFGGTASYLLLYAQRAGRIELYVGYVATAVAVSVIGFHLYRRWFAGRIAPVGDGFAPADRQTSSSQD